MNKIIPILILITISFFAFSGQSNKKVAIVKVAKGTVSIISPSGGDTSVKRGQWLKEGTIVKTGSRSFARISFIDKSSMNIGPNSEIKIEKFSKNKAGVINVLSGKIRAKISKDYLGMKKGKSKLFVKSRSAVMGIRGTDFIFTTSKKTGASTAVLFEGSVVFNKLNKGDNTRNLESIVNRGRRIRPGQFSIAVRGKNRATVPSKMSAKQFIKLDKNDKFKITDTAKGPQKRENNSMVPPGLSGDVVMSDSKNLKKEINKISKQNVKSLLRDQNEEGVEESKGFIKGEDIKPADGSLVHLESGTVIPMGIDSNYDANSGQWNSTTNGGVDQYGEYQPPAKHEITDEGQLLRKDPITGEVVQISTEIGVPVDERPAFKDIIGVKYEDSPEIEDGPRPAGDKDEEVIEPHLINPDGEIRFDEDGNQILRDIPKPGDCSTCNQPNTKYNRPDGGGIAGPSTKVRIRVK
jgi:hypothetical protein